MDLLSKRSTNRGFADALATAFEFAATLLIFVGIGWLVDRWLGTTPVFMIGLSLFAMVGLMAKAWLEYEAKMKRHEAELRAPRQAAADVAEGADR